MLTGADHPPRATPAPGAADAPAGGLVAVALFAACGHLGLELVSNFLPIVYPILVADAGFSFAQVGTVALVATLGMTLPQPLFGMLVRRFDAGRLVIVAVLWCGLFYGLVGLAGDFWPLLAAVALGGLGSALFHPAGSVVAAAARSERRGAARSSLWVGGNAGAALSPLLLAAVIGRQGLAGTLATIPLAAATALVLLLLARHGAVPASTDLGLRWRKPRVATASMPAVPSGSPADASPATAQRPRTTTGADGGSRPTRAGGDASSTRRIPETCFARGNRPAAAARSGVSTHQDPEATATSSATSTGTGGSTTALPLARSTGEADSRAAPAMDGAAHRDRRSQRSTPATFGTGAAVCALSLIVLFAMTRAWYQVSLTTYLPLWVAEHAGARVGIVPVLFVLAGSLPAGAVLGGAISDRVGRWQVVLAAGLLMVPANAALLAVGPGGGPASLLMLTAAIGCLIGATYPVAIIIAQEAWPRNIGLAGGMIMGLGWLPGGVGASAVGMMADNVGLARALATQVIPLLVGVLAIGGYAVLNARTRLGDRRDQPEGAKE